jgi:transposase
VTGDCHARICGSPGVRFPRATRLRKEQEARGAEPPRPLNADERAELERLREEVRRLRMEAELAKK